MSGETRFDQSEDRAEQTELKRMVGSNRSEGKLRKTWKIEVEQEYQSIEERSEKSGAKIEERSRIKRLGRGEKSIKSSSERAE